MVPPIAFLILGAMVFLLAMVGFLTRRSLVQALMCLELMTSAVALTFLALGRALGDRSMTGMVFATFCMVVSAAEIGMGLALVLLYFRKHGTTSSDDLDLMKG